MSQRINEQNTADTTIDHAERIQAEKHLAIRSNSRYRRQRGAGIIEEYGIYLLVAGIVLIAVLVAFARTLTDTEVQQLTSELNSVVGKTKATYRGQYSKVTMSGLVNNGIFKDLTTMTVSGTNVIVQPGGAQLAVAPAQLLSANDAIQWTLSQQPDAACSAIVAAYQGSAGKIVVNGTTIKAVGGSVDPSQITCSGGNNTINVLVA
ncbi:pilus assembly protein PilS [Cupriavidus sp. UYMU48A]|nr:pilus assembly protein PilS [Cupriavidus sp. UYMU48A]